MFVQVSPPSLYSIVTYEKESCEGIGIKDLTVYESEVFVMWKWAREDTPPSSNTDSENRSESSPQCEEENESDEGESVDPENSVKPVTNHIVIFKVTGTVKEKRYEKVLESCISSG